MLGQKTWRVLLLINGVPLMPSNIHSWTSKPVFLQTHFVWEKLF